MQRWRSLDREVQGLVDSRCWGAQAVVDVAEDTRRIARSRGSNALDDLCALYERVSSAEAKLMVRRSLAYLRADEALDPHRAGTAEGRVN